jgi:hypothetical protein
MNEEREKLNNKNKFSRLQRKTISIVEETFKFLIEEIHGYHAEVNTKED